MLKTISRAKLALQWPVIHFQIICECHSGHGSEIYVIDTSYSIIKRALTHYTAVKGTCCILMPTRFVRQLIANIVS